MDESEFAFDLGDDRWKRAATVAGFVLDAVPAIRIVAGGDNDAAGGVTLAHELRDGGRGARLVAKQNGRTRGADNSGDDMGHGVRSVAMIEADDDTFARIFAANDVTRDGLCDGARVGKSEIVGNDAAPAVRAELDGRHEESV